MPLLHALFIYWAIPELRCTIPKVNIAIYPMFSPGNKKKMLFGWKGNEDMGIPKLSNGFGYKKKRILFFFSLSLSFFITCFC